MDRAKIIDALLGKLRSMPLGWNDQEAAAKEAFDLGGGFMGSIAKVDPSHFKDLFSVFDNYNTMPDLRKITTAQDVLYALDGLPQDAQVPKYISSAAMKYRKAMDEDFYLHGGRGDVEPYEDAFIGAIEKLYGKYNKP